MKKVKKYDLEVGIPQVNMTENVYGDWVKYKDYEKLENLLKEIVKKFKLVLDPPPPPPDAIHASAFGRAGAGMVEDGWKNWVKKLLKKVEDFEKGEKDGSG